MDPVHTERKYEWLMDIAYFIEYKLKNAQKMKI